MSNMSHTGLTCWQLTGFLNLGLRADIGSAIWWVQDLTLCSLRLAWSCFVSVLGRF